MKSKNLPSKWRVFLLSLIEHTFFKWSENMEYQYNLLEDYIQKFYEKLNIHHPHQLNIESISKKLELVVYYIPHKSMCIAGNMFIDIHKSPQEQWQSFGHELCHALWHSGNQSLIHKLFRDYQEIKANNFALHVCIPTFMLQRLDLPNDDQLAINLIMKTFNVGNKFAEKRLRQHVANFRLDYPLLRNTY